MARMATTRRGKRGNGGRLTAVDGWGATSADELVELRTQLAAAGTPGEVLRALDARAAPLGLESAEQFNPAQLDLNEVNKALSGSATVLLTG
jgi:hypothetical protein